mgnify:CR=1 FL=1
MRMSFDGYDAKTVNPDTVTYLQDKYGYNEDIRLNEFISTVYLVKNPNFKYNNTVILSPNDFQTYYDNSFTYDFDEWSCISWFIDSENVFHSVCLDEDTFFTYQRKLTSQDDAVIQQIRSEFGQREIKI